MHSQLCHCLRVGAANSWKAAGRQQGGEGETMPGNSKQGGCADGVTSAMSWARSRGAALRSAQASSATSVSACLSAWATTCATWERSTHPMA